MPRLLCSLLLAATLPAQLANYTFSAASFQTTSGGLFCDVTGDLDGDGDLDLLQRQQTAIPQFQVWLNQDNLQFTVGTPLQTPNGANYAMLVDLNGDGRLDFIYTAGLGTIVVHLGLPSAAFGAAAPIPTASSFYIQGLATGDANGDGISDLAVLRTPPQSASATWLLGSASGQFTEQTITLPVTQAPSYLTMAVLDADSDGSDDLAVASTAQLWLLRSQAGAPTVASNTPFATNSVAPQLLAGDLDGDNDTDVVAYAGFFGANQPTVRRLVNQGGGTFSTASTLTLPTTMALATGYLADWDHDGDGDLLLRGSSYGSLLLALLGNDGTAFSIAWTDNSRESSPYSGFGLGVRDFDGDGNQDLVDNDLVFFGNGTLQPEGAPLYVSEFGVRDFENDGDPDFPGANELWRNDGRGMFVPEVLAMPAAAPGEMFALEGSPLADFDGDGLPEMLVPAAAAPFGNPFLRLHRFEYSGQGQFVNLGPASNSSFPLLPPAFAIDTNGDGVLDVVDRTRVWTNNGAHQFQPLPPQFQGYQLLASGDIDGDGDVDLIGASVGMTTFAVLRLTAADTFSIQVFATEPFANYGPNRPVLTDLDGDGDLDVAVSNSPTGSEVRIYRNQGGVLTWAATLPKPSEFVETRAMAGDLDSDGRVDLAVSNGQSVRLWRRNGPGFTYDPPVVLPRAGIRDLVDVDQDGDADMVGSSVWLARSVGPAQGGQRRQFGLGLPGTGGRRPWLGASGRIRPGFVPSLRGADGLGGSLALLAVGTAEASAAIPGLPSLVLYAPPSIALLTVSLTGTFGQAGVGSLDLPVAVPAGLQGLSFFFQMFVLDPAVPDLLTFSNGLEFRIGG